MIEMLKKIRGGLNFKVNKKAQVWAIDLSIALILFVGIIFLFYNYSLSYVPEDPIINKMVREGGYATNALLTTGYPDNWEELENFEEVISLGILDEEGFLDYDKIKAFIDMVGDEEDPVLDANYRMSRSKINTKYNYYITLAGDERMQPAPYFSIGRPFEGTNAKQVIMISRVVVYNYTTQDNWQIMPLKLTLYLWSREG